MRLHALTRRALSQQPVVARRFASTSYRSPFAPKYKTQFNLYGITQDQLWNVSFIGGGMAASLGFFALFFFADVPRVSVDIMQKLPLIGHKFKREIAPEDNPF
ncbi:hypothetical protein P152DRAFT_460737 [Eremomyces bilateralis CBS 781.70]|uniref:Uncharacterized protein n=1 Tax=Eremomyces bilateralis CBS 781.70 TaxID=1392243 RepID=A0A6G1FWS1_9PEZI|nr:uncharacterized protein P152DRAFT_460737 [Eremomyces bilateralis CBS 781.70]KAF1810233.1 hypothetical protein P152DRAFT_460737 [Eremomyces bilateralis CBS 781.70]